MKRKDIVTIAAVALLSLMVSLAVSNFIFVPAKNRHQTIETIDPILADFDEPSDQYFNQRAVNPTQIIRVEENNNPSPFRAN